MRTPTKRGNNQKKVSTERQKSIIAVSSQTFNRYARVIKGKRSETKQLNIHLKTHISYCLRVAISQNQLTQLQIQIVKKYQQMTASFKSLQYLFFGIDPFPEKHITQKRQQSEPVARKGLTKICLDFFKSRDILDRVLSSTRMHINNKLIFVKYLKSVEQKLLSKKFPQDYWKPKKFFSIPR